MVSSKSRFRIGISLALALALAIPVFTEIPVASGTTGVISAVAGNYGIGGTPDGSVATGNPLFIPEGIAVDPEGNYIYSQINGDIFVVANSPSNPGYPLRADCGSGSSQCAWTVGDTFIILGNGSSSVDGVAATDFPGDNAGGVAIDSEGNVLVPEGGGFNLLVVIAMSATNPGYPLRADCGSPPISQCVWTPGSVYFVAGSNSNSGFNDGVSAQSSLVKTIVEARVDSGGNVLMLDEGGQVSNTFSQGGALLVLAMTNSNPGYPLASDCGSGSSPCSWTKGDVFRIAGSYSVGSLTDGASAESWKLDNPLGFALDASGNVVIADSSNNALEVLAVSNANPGYVLGSDCGSGSSPCTWTQGDMYILDDYLGSVGSATSGASALSTVIGTTGGPDFDSQGNLLVPNYGADVLEMLALSNCSSNCSYGLSSYTKGDMYVIAGIGNTSGSSPYGDGGPATSANLGGPGTSFVGTDFSSANPSDPFTSYAAFDPATRDVVLVDTPLNTIRSFSSGIPATPATTTTTSTTSTSTTSTTVVSQHVTTSTSTTTTVPSTTLFIAKPPSLSFNIYFSLGESIITASVSNQLVKEAVFLKNHHYTSLNVVGYSDPLSSGEAAYLLGLHRAQAVTAYLSRDLRALHYDAMVFHARSGQVLHLSPYRLDRVAVVTSRA